MAHRRARLTVFGRQLLVARVEAGWREAHVVEQLGISRATAYTWVRRHRTDGPAGLEDRSSRPRHSPRRLAALQAASTQPTPGAPWVDQKHPSSEPYRLVPRGWLSASDWPGGTQVERLWADCWGCARGGRRTAAAPVPVRGPAPLSSMPPRMVSLGARSSARAATGHVDTKRPWLICPGPGSVGCRRGRLTDDERRRQDDVADAVCADLPLDHVE